MNILRFRLAVARWILLVCGLILLTASVVKQGLGKTAAATEAGGMGALVLTIWLIWMVVRRRTRRALEVTSPDDALPGNTDTMSYEEQKAAFIQSIPGLARLHIEKAQSVFERELAFDVDAFQTNDEIILEGWGGQVPETQETIVPFGAFIGETIRHLHGGEWGHSEDEGYFLGDVGGQSLKIYPFEKVRKRFVNGEEDSLDFYYRVIQHQLELGARD